MNNINTNPNIDTDLITVPPTLYLSYYGIDSKSRPTYIDGAGLVYKALAANIPRSYVENAPDPMREPVYATNSADKDAEPSTRLDPGQRVVFACFARVISALNDMKKLMTYMDMHRGEDDIDALYKALWSRAAELAEVESEKLSVAGSEQRIFELAYDDALDRLYMKIDQLEEDDEDWYRDYGDFWNEVYLPTALEDLFNEYVKKLSLIVPGLIGPEETGVIYENGTALLSYYDLSGIGLVFEDVDVAESFACGNPIDPTDIAVYDDIGWFAL